MGSETPLRLPVIDFSKEGLNPGTSEWDTLKAQVQQAVGVYGCFEALFDKVPMALRKAIFGASEEFFNLPLQTKMRNVSKKPYHGYIGQYPEVPLFEGIGIDEANDLAKVESVTDVLWPERNPSFSKTIQSFTKQLSELDQTIRRMILESFGLEIYIDEHMNSTNYLLRVAKYKAPQTSEAKIGLHAHTDKNTMTILYQNQVVGLGVQTKDGEWIELKPSLDSFIVMIGESLYAWTNGRVHSPHHRVMMTGNETRYSVGLFSVPKAGYIIKAPEELVDKEHPLLFKPHDHVEFLGFYYSEAGRRAESALKTYCGRFQAKVTVKGLDFECSSGGELHPNPREARESAAAQILAKLQSLASQAQ